MQLTRRNMLAGAAAGGGLLLAWNLLPRRFDTPLEPGTGEIAFDAWLKIAADGVVTVAVPQLEMGQGITTLLPQIVAMELGADWRQIAVEPAPVSGGFANLALAALWSPLWRPLVPMLNNSPDDFLLERWAQDHRFTATAAGTSLAAYELPCRLAAASARAMLAMAAADKWEVDWEECRAEGGFIYHDQQRASFASLALAAAGFDPPSTPPLKADAPAETAPPGGPQDEDRVIAFPRLDLPSKVDGSHVFAGDVRLPGMVFAAIRHGPWGSAQLGAFDAGAAAGQRGFIKLVQGKRWLAAIARNSWAAERALDKALVRFKPARVVESEAIGAALDQAIRHGAAQYAEVRGAGDEGYEANFAVRYDVAPALHAGLETTTATARLMDGTLELWMPTQSPETARAAAAAALGMSAGDVVLYPVSAGGSFDARLEHGAAIEAALLAREAGAPVQLVWSRWQEHLALPPRTPAVGMIGAKVDGGGSIRQMRMRIASPASGQEFGHRLFGNLTAMAAIDAAEGAGDPMAAEGLMPPYNIAHVAVQHIPVKIDLPTARMRGNAHGYTCFMRESFIDEVAQQHGREPLSYRIAMLGQDAALVQCLQRAARLAQWDGGAPGTGQGLACHVMQLGERTGRIALIATATRGAGGVRVSRMDACVDIGRVINRDIALQQIEGALVFGLGLALGCSTEYSGGLPAHGRLASLALPTLADCPEIRIDLVDSTAEPFDPGEIGVAPVAPAIANALFSATGLRLRRLPLLSEAS